MALFAISDLHLPLGKDKPMDVFGPMWDNYVERLSNHWQNTVSDEDIVVMPGDFSWATYIDEAKPDFEFLNKLNGRKILLKGNHDYWWETYSKMSAFLKENAYDTISILNNNAYFYGNIAICGTRGWTFGENMTEEDTVIYNREIGRLRLSLDYAVKNNAERFFVFTHYPPLTPKLPDTPFCEVLREYNVEKCFYGHLHADSHKFKVTGVSNGVEYCFISAEYIDFTPFMICEKKQCKN